MRTRRKKAVMSAIAVFVAIVAGVIAYFASYNSKIINQNIELALNALGQRYTVTESTENEYSEITVFGILKSHARRYDVGGLGNLCVMTMNMGIRQIAAFVLTPYEKNMPMLSSGFIYAFGRRRALIELYDLTEDTRDTAYQNVLSELQSVIDLYADLPDDNVNSAWYDFLVTARAYKSCGSKQDARLSRLFADTVAEYAESAARLEPLDEYGQSAKLGATREYCDALLEKGSAATDVFRKALGSDAARDFFERVFFGTARRAQ